MHDVLHLFERFESSSDDKALFVVHLIVDDRSRIRYSPEPEEMLRDISALLDKVKHTICSVPVIQCSLAEVENYNSLMIMSSHEADAMLQEAKAHLSDIYRQKIRETEGLIEKFDAYSFVLKRLRTSARPLMEAHTARLAFFGNHTAWPIDCAFVPPLG